MSGLGRPALPDLLDLAHRATLMDLGPARDVIRSEEVTGTAAPQLTGERKAAVLILIGPSDGRADAAADECDVLLMERSAALVDHPGQISFPGGGIEPQDASVTATALREAVEETGIDVDAVRVLGELPPATVSVSNFHVTPVLAWWQRPCPVWAVDPAETARVFRAPIRELLDPGHRIMATITRGGATFLSPTFLVQEAVVWGFTGGVLSKLFDELGWARPWDTSRRMPAPI